MDQQQPNQNIEKPQIILRSSSFLLSGQIQSNKQLQRKQFDASVYVKTKNVLRTLYSGFPGVSSKTDVTILTTFPIQYIPVRNDLVIGIIKIRTSESFIVDIASPMDSTLGGLEFDGVTKKNKPNLKVGAVVFCRVLQYSKHTGGQLSCMNKGISNRKGNLLGELKQGFLFWLPTFKHQYIQENLLERVGKCVKFEVAFGKNGRIWINSANLQNIMLIYNMFQVVANGAQQQKINALISLIK